MEGVIPWQNDPGVAYLPEEYEGTRVGSSWLVTKATDLAIEQLGAALGQSSGHSTPV